MIWILPLVLLIAFEAIADTFAEEYALHGGWFWFAAITCYVIGNTFWLYSIRHGSGLARGAAIFSVSTAVLATSIGFFAFHEKLHYLQTLGIVLGLVSLILIFWKQ